MGGDLSGRLGSAVGSLTPRSINTLAITFAAANTAVNAVFHLPCPLFAATGLLCPLCGGTRALMAISEGHLSAALSLNAMVICALPALGLLSVIRWSHPLLFERLAESALRHDMLASIALFGGWFLIRNFMNHEF